MKKHIRWNTILSFLILLAFVLSLAGCAAQPKEDAPQQPEASSEPDTSRFLVAVDSEPDTVDFQCTTFYYSVATNVFNRLIEMESDGNGGMELIPHLAESWEVSGDGRDYTFHLRENVRFSNGSPLTAEDVQYTFERLLTHPDSCNRDIVDCILGAQALMEGQAEHLEGFKVLDDLTFTITLEEPFEGFLACLTMPGASILDRETTQEAGDRFGTDPEWTIGTGSFILWKWTPGEGMLLKANPDCWMGAPKCEGLNLIFASDPKEIRRMFEDGELDVLDLDEVGNYAEFFLRGEEYQDRTFVTPRIGITYIALNESIEPLNDVRVRKAMQLSLNRPMILSAVYGDRGSLENGIFPHGLYGYNPELPEIPYDPDQAAELLKEAGLEDGFDLTVGVQSNYTTRWEMSVLKTAVSMWEKVGIRAKIDVMDEADFMRDRKSGKLMCFTALWTADFNDPDNFIYTFFGNRENTTFRSLCYPREDVMERVRKARGILNPEERIQEYQDLERLIVQEEAAWIPLFSRNRYYVTSERLKGIQAYWNGAVKYMFREMSIEETD